MLRSSLMVNVRNALSSTAVWLFAALAGPMAARSASAAELVTLRSGFSLTCSSREALPDEMVRLHLSGGGESGTNFMDVPRSAVVNVSPAPENAPVPVPLLAVAWPAAEPLAGLLRKAGAAHNMNVALLASVVRAESAGNPRAVSRSGARGLMQLMPSTARALRVEDSFEPAQNVDGGSAYLDQLLTRYHEDMVLALAAYNAGPGAVDRYHGMPPFRETRLYVARVIREFNRLVRQDAAASVAAAMPSRADR